MQLNTIYRSVDYSLDGAGVPVMSSREYELIDAGVAESEQCTKLYIYFRTFDDFDNNPWGIALDVTGGKIYWKVHPISSEGEGKIQRANLNGPNAHHRVGGAMFHHHLRPSGPIGIGLSG